MVLPNQTGTLLGAPCLVIPFSLGRFLESRVGARKLLLKLMNDVEARHIRVRKGGECPYLKVALSVRGAGEGEGLFCLVYR